MALALLGALLLVLVPALGQGSLGVASAQAARPDANVPAGARALPDRSFLRNERSASDFYVDPVGDNLNPGTKEKPWKTVGHATKTLTAGKVACVNSGTYDEPGASVTNSGTETAPIVLKRTPGSPTRPIIRLDRPSPVLRIDRGYWIVDGLEFDLNRQRTTGMVFGPSGHHIALRNSYVHDDARGAAVYVSADDVSIEGSEIANNFHYLGEDSHGITVFGQAARVLVRGNRIHDNGGDGLQCADETDQDESSDGQLPSDVTIEDNRLWTSPANQGRTEQGVDIKTCQQVSIRGSVRPDANDPNAANQKFYGFKSSSSAAGGGGAVVIHLGARNALVENNRIWDSCHGVGIGRHDTALGVPANVVVRRNAMFDLKAIGGACKGYGIGIQRVDSADVYHNTLDRVEGSAFFLRHGYGGERKSPNVDFFNNIVHDASSFLDLATGEISGFGSDHNLFYWSRDENQSRFRIDGVAQSLDSWQRRQNGTSVLLADGNSRVADPLFVPGAGTTDDYYTQAASLARDRALDNTGAARFGTGPDLGFRETYDSSDPGGRCDTATAGAPWPGEAFGPQSGKFTATLDATPLGARIAAGVGLSQGTAQHWTGMAAIVLFDDVSGNIKARDGGAYTAASPIPYQANAKYRVRFVVDVAA
ncbi:MAG: right-handed parallel beta-helix repeat-containing protein, partial [Actinobacteria bacterium]|nr:right-handed parallel beta-helix repeat-containing protein [Actinomycetota bacterium]